MGSYSYFVSTIRGSKGFENFIRLLTLGAIPFTSLDNPIATENAYGIFMRNFISIWEKCGNTGKILKIACNTHAKSTPSGHA